MPIETLASHELQTGVETCGIERLTRDELQDWLDNLPENLQSGSKADELDEAISSLDDVINDIDNAINNAENVNFPGMF